MTAPRIDTEPAGPSHVLSGAEWEQSQYLAGNAVATTPFGPGAKAGAKPSTSNLGRILTGDEWEQAQRMPGSAVKTWQLPALPAIPAAPRDVTRTPMDPHTKGTKITTPIVGAVMRQAIDPMLENPFTSVATLAAPAVAAGIAPAAGVAVGAAMAGSMVYHIAQYGWQKAAELQLSPEDRARAEADPERISGESAAVQAAMLGLAPLIHVGVKLGRGLDYGGGMVEAGAAGVKDINFEPHASPTALSVSEYQAQRVAQDVADLKDTPLSAQLTAEDVRTPRRVPQKEALAQSVKDYEARRVAEEQAALSDARAADAARVVDAQRTRRRAKDAAGPAPYFESPQGAEVLGMQAARHGLPNDANPYHPDSPLAQEWTTGHAAATESFPEGFSMGGQESRIPAASEVPKVARGSDTAPGAPPIQDQPSLPGIPDGATPETVALAASLKPSRFRGHTTDALVDAVVEARTRLEEAQAAEYHHSEGQYSTDRVQAIMANGEDWHPFYDEKRAKETARAKTALAQIERELAMRGVTGDHLAEKIQEAQVMRAEREGMQSDETLTSMMGGFDPFADPAPTADPVAAASASAQEPSGALPTVEGTGALRTRGLAAGVERKAIANKLELGLGELPQYRAINMAEQAAHAVEFIASDPALARRVAMGEAPAPAHLLPESVFVAVENKATLEGDVATLRDLATRSELTTEATKMGQRIRALGERDPDSPVAAIQGVVDARSGGKNAPKAAAEIVAQIRSQLEKSKLTPAQWAEFVNSLRC